MGFGLCIRVGVELVVLAHAGGGLVGKKLGGRMGTIPGKSEGVSLDPRFEISKNALFQIITVVTYLKSNKSKKNFCCAPLKPLVPMYTRRAAALPCKNRKASPGEQRVTRPN